MTRTTSQRPPCIPMLLVLGARTSVRPRRVRQRNKFRAPSQAALIGERGLQPVRLRFVLVPIVWFEPNIQS